FPSRSCDAAYSSAETCPSLFASRLASSSASFSAKVRIASSLLGKSRTVAELKPGSCASPGCAKPANTRNQREELQRPTASLQRPAHGQPQSLDTGCLLDNGFTAAIGFCISTKRRGPQSTTAVDKPTAVVCLFSSRSRMRVRAPVLRGGFVREDLVIGHVVEVHVIAGRAANHRRTYPQITDERGDCDVHHVIAEAPSVRP